MTILVPCRCLGFYFSILFSDIKKMPKISETVSGASVDSNIMKNYSLSRSNSFSSCSNDSDQTDQRKFRNGKRLNTNVHSTNVSKRSRNSSGSSISSNRSYLSDKELKSSGGISQTSRSRYQITKNIIREPSTNYSSINRNNVELKEKSIVNETVSCTNNSFTISPTPRTLRTKITRKGCACCPSTHTTVFFRRSEFVRTEFVQTTEKKTVISNTKVKTYVQKNRMPTTLQTVKENDKTSKSKTRKRRSEIEKLYESLHEIEWAKNFSPDNILSQINVRQAASCSVFGKSPIISGNLSKNSRRQKASNNKHNPCLVKLSPAKQLNFSNTQTSNTLISNINHNFGSSQNLDNFENVESHVSCCKLNHKPCSLQSSVNENNDILPVSCNQSPNNSELLTMNGADSSNDAQFSYTSDESSSTLSNQTVNVHSKHLLSMHLKDKNGIRDPDYSTSAYFNIAEENVQSMESTPTFLDIAEEGIRTIDACFREVAAEITVSTCYDDENSLPMLTSVKESGAVDKNSKEQSPPVLEPCVTVAQENNPVLTKTSKKQVKAPKTVYNNKYIKQGNKQKHFNNTRRRKLKERKCKQKIIKGERLTGNAQVSNKNVKHGHTKSSQKILNKYKKLLSCRKKTKLNADLCPLKSLVCTDKESKEIPSKNESQISPESNDVKNKQYLTVSIPFKKVCISEEKLSGDNVVTQNVEEKQFSYKCEDRVTFGCASNSCFYDNRNHKESTETVVTQKTGSCTVTQCRSVISSFVSTKQESDCMISKEHISRSPLSVGLFSPYQSIKVNRSINYTQIILKLTRGKSIFLTLEAITELTDVLIRTNNDSSCPVLIINGIGDSFCLGIDLKPLVGPKKNTVTTEMAIAIKELIEALSDFKKPLAAVVNGPALGLGMTLLNHADFTIASDKATFCMPHSYLGYMPEGGATLTLPQVVGSTVAMDLLLRGRTLTALEARNVGLISDVLEARYLPSELVSRVKLLAGNSLSALETTKAILKMQLHVNLRLVLENEVKILPRMWLTKSCQTALQKALSSGIFSE